MPFLSWHVKKKRRVQDVFYSLTYSLVPPFSFLKIVCKQVHAFKNSLTSLIPLGKLLYTVIWQKKSWHDNKIQLLFSLWGVNCHTNTVGEPNETFFFYSPCIYVVVLISKKRDFLSLKYVHISARLTVYSQWEVLAICKWVFVWHRHSSATLWGFFSCTTATF